MKLLSLAFALVCLCGFAAFGQGTETRSSDAVQAPVTSLRITVFSTMLAGDLQRGIGEWGFAALVEVNGKRVLFDTGQRPNTVLNNAKELGIDLTGISELVLSHGHSDHVGGLVVLRRAFAATSPETFSRVHVATGAFVSRGPGDFDGDDNPLIAMRPQFEATGGTFVEHNGPVELLPGVWFTGPIPRKHANEQPVPKGWVLRAPDGSLIPDTTPEDSALVFDTNKGLVVLTGCGHAGLVNTLEYARAITRHPTATVYAVTGGFHLVRAPNASLDWTVEQLRSFGVKYIHGGHCTGLEAVYRLRQSLTLPREAVSVAAVGSWFDLAEGIHPLVLAQ